MHRRVKSRLYVGLYARPKHHNSYHEALIIGPKNVSSPSGAVLKFHVKNTLQVKDGEPLQPWVYEATTIPSLADEDRLLVLVCIGKLETSNEELGEVFSRVPIYQKDDPDVEKAREFSCSTWVEWAIAKIRVSDSVLVTHLTEWSTSKQRAYRFVEDLKTQGRWEVGWKGEIGIPSLNLLE